MAFASDSTNAPFGHPRLLRATLVPTPPLTATTVDMLDAIEPDEATIDDVRRDLEALIEQGSVPPLLPAPAPLPSLATALSRRRAIFGAVVASMPLAGCSRRSKHLCEVGGEASDAHLTLLAADLDRTLDGAAYALAPVYDHEDHDARLDRAECLLLRMAEIPATGAAGLKAKAKAYLDSEGYDVQQLHAIAESLAHDVERLHAAGGIV